MARIILAHGERAHVLNSGIAVVQRGSWLDKALGLRRVFARLRPPG